jgi:probable selenium-dependent hydroxylase accessory protein YqeC
LYSEQFGFLQHALVNFVGGGGKTALIHKLMEEYCPYGPVICTTTTRIHPPDPSEGLVVLSCDNLQLLSTMVDRISQNCLNRSYKLVVTRHFMTPNLLRGVPPDFVNLLPRELFPILLNEADGAASYSIKMPRDGEPVLMENAQYLVPVIGIDCLYQPLGPDIVFRFEPAMADQYSLQPGDRITPDIAARILMHRDGVCKNWKTGMTIIPFINKVDGPAQDSAANDLAAAILNNGNFPVKRVLFGSVLQGRVDSVSAS